MCKKVYLYITSIASFDAISQATLMQYKMFKSLNYSVEIIYEYKHQNIDTHYPHLLCQRLTALSLKSLKRDALLVFHFSTYSCMMEALLGVQFARKIAFVHNITPPHFMMGTSNEQIQNLKNGISQIVFLKKFDELIFNSYFSMQETLGHCKDLPQNRQIAMPMSAEYLFQFQKSSCDVKVDKQLISIGRLAPNKNIERLIRIFRHVVDMDNNARLIHVGSHENLDYSDELFAQTKAKGLEGNLIFLNNVGRTELFEMIARSNLFISASKHEGFCVPIVESNLLGTRAMVTDQQAMVETASIFGNNIVYPSTTRDRNIAETIYEAYMSHTPYEAPSPEKLKSVRFIDDITLYTN